MENFNFSTFCYSDWALVNKRAGIVERPNLLKHTTNQTHQLLYEPLTLLNGGIAEKDSDPARDQVNTGQLFLKSK